MNTPLTLHHFLLSISLVLSHSLSYFSLPLLRLPLSSLISQSAMGLVPMVMTPASWVHGNYPGMTVVCVCICMFVCAHGVMSHTGCHHNTLPQKVPASVPPSLPHPTLLPPLSVSLSPSPSPSCSPHRLLSPRAVSSCSPTSPPAPSRELHSQGRGWDWDGGPSRSSPQPLSVFPGNTAPAR